MSDEVEALKSIDSLFIQTDNRWDVLADPPVSCMNFESFFGRKGRMITEPSIVDGLCKSIMFLKKSKHQKINPRCKIYFFSSDSIVTTACIGRKNTLFNGEVYITEPSLILYIDSISGMGTEKTLSITDKVDNHITEGLDSILGFINLHMNVFKNQEVYSLKGFCHADPDGNVLSVEITNKFKKYIPDDIIIEIKKLFKKHVKWNANKERMMTDMMLFRIKIPVITNSV